MDLSETAWQDFDAAARLSKSAYHLFSVESESESPASETIVEILDLIKPARDRYHASNRPISSQFMHNEALPQCPNHGLFDWGEAIERDPDIVDEL